MFEEHRPDPLYPPAPLPIPGRRRRVTAIVVIVILVLAFASLLVGLGLDPREAIIGAAGAALVAGEVAHRTVGGEDHRPALVVLTVVLIFAGLLLWQGYPLHESVLGAGMGALIAGAVAARILGEAPRPRWTL